MTEHLAFTPEKHETAVHPERLRLPDPEHAEALRPGEKVQPLDLNEARKDVHETIQADNQPNVLEQLQTAEKASQPAEPRHINRELRQITLRRELQQIRRKLPAPERLLSKVIHQPAVQAISETAGKTVSRPSGLLGGGLVALIGTSGYLYLAKHIGFEYNYLIFLLLFVAGFILGIVLELGVHAMTTSRRHQTD